MTYNELIRQYDNFDYDSEFIPNYNIFNINSNRFVGIGTNIPKHHLSVTNNLNIQGNIIVTGNLYYNNNSSIQYNDNFIHLLYKNKSNNIQIGPLIYSSPDSKYSNYNFYKKDDCLYVNTFDDRPNTIITYKSDIYSFDNTATSAVIDLIVSEEIFITSIYIYEKDTSVVIPTYNTLTLNTINTTVINDTYKLDQTIKLLPFVKNTLTLQNISNSSSSDTYIQFIGNYDFTAGSFWHNTNNDIHTLKNVSILSNSNYNNKLYVNGNSIINKNFTTNILKTNLLENSTNLKVNGFLNTSNIISDNLLINTNKLVIGNSSSEHFVTLGDSNSVSIDGNLNSTDLHINSNINLQNINTNDSKIVLSNNINLHDFITINNTSTQFLYNTIISTKPNYLSHNLDNNSLLVDGNVYVTENLNTNHINYNKLQLNDSYINSNINSLYVEGLTHTGVFTKVNDVLTETFISHNINLIPSIQKINNPGTIYYDTSTNTFKGHTKNNVVTFNYSNSPELDYSNFKISDDESILEVKNFKNDLLSTTHLETTHLESHKTFTDTLKLPVEGTSTNNYSDLCGTITFNTNSNEKLNIHDGEKWNIISFEQDFLSLTDTYTIIPNINLIKNTEQFIPTIPQNLKYNISQSDGSYYNSDITNSNQITIMSKNTYNLNLDEDFGISINNNIIGIGTNFYIANNINIFENPNNTENNIYEAILTEQSEYEDINYQFVHIEKIDNSQNANAIANNPQTDLQTYLNNEKNKNFHILNNRIHLNSGSNNYTDTHIKLKEKKLIANNKYSAYLYYEPLLDLLQILDNSQNLILDIDLNKYKYNILIPSSSTNQGNPIIRINFSTNISDTSISVNDQNYLFNKNSVGVSNNIIKIKVKNNTTNIYNIYNITYQIT